MIKLPHFCKSILSLESYHMPSAKSSFFQSILPMLPVRIVVLIVNIFTKEKFKLFNGTVYVNGTDRKHFILKDRIAIYRKGLDYRGRILGNSYHLELINFSQNDLIIDVGANVGDLLLYLPIHVKYIGVEPSPREFSLLSLNISSNCKIYKVAATNKNEVVTFFVASSEADSSLIEPPNYTKKISVEGIRLDKLVSEKIKLLKIDSEGGELETLYGCEGILDQVEYISIDLRFEKGILQESTFIPCLEFLQAHNFRLLRINQQFRCLFSNEEVLG